MENIIIISCKESPEAELWSDYLLSCFNKIMAQRARQNYKVYALTIEDMTASLEDNPKIKQVATGKLQLLILCPRMLAHVAELSNEALEALNVFDTEKVLVMQLGVDDDSILEVHRRAFLNYEQWERMIVVEQDNTFVDNFLGKAVDILSKKLLKPPSDKAMFSIIPKKIKPGQNRVIALLNDPITSNDTMTIQVDKNGEILHINSFKRRNPYTLQFDVPDCCLEVSMLVWIKIEKNGTSCGSRQIKCESRLRELDQILRASDNPLEFMCQTLGFKMTDRDQLDSWMLTAFQRNIPPHFNLLSAPLNEKVATGAAGIEEYPTLLHFAARFGLERLSWQLLECPGGEAACATRNSRQQTPADLAQQHGFTQLASVLRGYMQMNEFSNMYYYLKNMSEDTVPQMNNNVPSNNVKILNTDHTPEGWAKYSAPKTTPVNTPDSVKSDPFSDECLDNLENKPQKINHSKVLESPKVFSTPKQVASEWLYENDFNQMNTSFTSTSSVQRAIEHDYLIQPSNKKVECFDTITQNGCRPTDFRLNQRSSSACEFTSPSTPYKLPPEFFSVKNNSLNNISITKSKHKSQDHISSLSGQDELAEIINDFKNNVFTISEVEKLVMDWKNRNETQQSLKEKQDQLNKMREEYDRLQKRIKDDMKRPTPFERVRKIFSKNKNKSSKNTPAEAASNGNGTAQRPNSGLSLHSLSSSSSGRLSTASGASIGDSGTQSDNEDSKIFAELKTPKSPNKMDRFILEDYLIPPPPRPLSVAPQRITQFTGKHQPLPPIPMDTINEREPAQETTCGPNKYMSNDICDHQYMNMSPA